MAGTKFDSLRSCPDDNECGKVREYLISAREEEKNHQVPLISKNTILPSPHNCSRRGAGGAAQGYGPWDQDG